MVDLGIESAVGRGRVVGEWRGRGKEAVATGMEGEVPRGR